jgi:hypothetical protein
MTKQRGAGEGPAPVSAVSELVEFARGTPPPPADAAFRDALRSHLWELLHGLLDRLRGR